MTSMLRAVQGVRALVEPGAGEFWRIASILCRQVRQVDVTIAAIWCILGPSTNLLARAANFPFPWWFISLWSSPRYSFIASSGRNHLGFFGWLLGPSTNKIPFDVCISSTWSKMHCAFGVRALTFFYSNSARRPSRPSLFSIAIAFLTSWAPSWALLIFCSS